MSTRVRILSIDGGGIRGIIPAMVLAELERRAQRPICQLFDLIAGTSTGGILALGLVKPQAERQPAYAATDLITLYEDAGPAIFAPSSWHRIPVIGTLLELFSARYRATNIGQVLERYFGDVRLSQALTPVLITSYELEKRDPWFFRSERAKHRPDYDFPMREVARATSAAPTYFPPLGLRAPRPVGEYALVDGGVYANNPAMCAYVEAHTLHPDGGTSCWCRSAPVKQRSRFHTGKPRVGALQGGQSRYWGSCLTASVTRSITSLISS